METRASNIAVGAFVLLLLLGGIGFVFWVGKLGERTAMASHFSRFLELIQGVSEGAPVLFGGIPIGHVTKVGVDPQDSTYSRIDMVVDASAPIRGNSVATLQLRGLTGGVLVDISRGRSEAPLIADGAEIPSRYTPIQRLITGMPGLEAKANLLLDNATTLFSSDNMAAAGRIMDNVQKFQALLASNTVEVGKTLDSLGAAGKQISNTNAEFRSLGADMQAFVGKIGGEVDAASREGRALSAILGRLAADFKKASDEDRQSIDDFTATGLYEFPAMVAEVNLTMRIIKRISSEIAANPAQYFLQDRQAGFEPPAPTKPRH